MSKKKIEAVRRAEGYKPLDFTDKHVDTLIGFIVSYKNHHGLNACELCEQMGISFSIVIYRFLNKKEKPSQKRYTYGHEFLKAANKLYEAANGDVNYPLPHEPKVTVLIGNWMDRNIPIIDDKINKDVDLSFRRVKDKVHVTLTAAHKGVDITEIEELLKKLSTKEEENLVVDAESYSEKILEVGYDFPAQDSIACGGTAIAPLGVDNHYPISTLFAIATQYGVGITVNHALPPIDNDDHDIDNRIYVSFISGVQELGCVTKRAQNLDMCIFEVSTQLPVISNYVLKIGPVRFPTEVELHIIREAIFESILQPQKRIVVKKYGATTGLTYGEIVSLNQQGELEIHPLRHNQVISERGDSGAAWVIEGRMDLKNVVVGMHTSSRTNPNLNVRVAFAIFCEQIMNEIDTYVDEQIN